MRGLLKTYQKNSPGHAGVLSTTHHRYKDTNILAAPQNNDKYERRNSQDLTDGDRPKTKEEMREERIKEKERLRVARAADRRDQWISMNVNDPDFIQGKEQLIIKSIRVLTGCSRFVPLGKLKIPRFQRPRNVRSYWIHNKKFS
jgi:hypothetical protein